MTDDIPGTGSMVAAVKTAAGREPVVLGKPSRFMFEIVQKRHPSIVPERTLMIGDRFVLVVDDRLLICIITQGQHRHLAWQELRPADPAGGVWRPLPGRGQDLGDRDPRGGQDGARLLRGQAGRPPREGQQPLVLQNQDYE